MADIFCQKCGKANPADVENCEFCGALLPPPPASADVDSQPIKLGEDPIKIDTAVFEKGKQSKGDPVHAGEAPTKKDTAELEETLPGWLRALRERKDAEEAAAEEESPGEEIPLEPAPTANLNPLDDQPDWLTGLGKTGTDDQEEIPGWLTSLGIEKTETPAPPSSPTPPVRLTGSLTAGMGQDELDMRLSYKIKTGALDTKPLEDQPGEVEPPESTPPDTAPLNDLQGEPAAPEFSIPETAPLGDLQAADLFPEPGISETAPLPGLQGENGSLDWFKSLMSEPAIPETAVPETAETPAASQDEGLQDWLSDIPDSSGENKLGPGQEEADDWEGQVLGQPHLEPSPGGDKGVAAGPAVPDWLSNLRSTSEMPETPAEESLPDWLTTSEIPTSPEASASTSAADENLPDWLPTVESKPGVETAPPPSAGGEPLPDWMPGAETSVSAEPAVPATPPGEKLPDWLSSMETAVEREPAAPLPKPVGEPPAPGKSPDEIPKWLSQFQADVNAAADKDEKEEQFEKAAPQEKKEGTGPLPDWLAGIERSSTPASGTPALITSEESAEPGDKGGAAFSMEMPDWLTKLKPDQAREKTPEGMAEPAGPGSLEVSQLPSWVQAMRPVESVVETKVPPQEDEQVTEQSGPLAGLLGVLPATPGLGELRKPPAYSPLLQVTDGQQRHAASFEKIISNETQPAVARKPSVASNRLGRWLIAGLLILAVGIPLVTKIPVTKAGILQPKEMVAAYNVVSALPINSPVLVVFDYDPALSGELEAAAAPLMDNLLLQGARLALISTSPTGPVLGEHLLHNSSVSDVVAGHNYQPGEQYVNLGYLAGGPSGVQFFVNNPMAAARFTVEGKDAWQLKPLEGIQRISDFAALLILTDNADRGRIWIEQTDSRIGTTPILMVISAQAEPMILPYYDSGQVKGLVTGLAGGEAYSQLFVRQDAHTSPAQIYLNSFSAGTLVAEILIVLGALVSAVAGWGAGRKLFGKGS